MRVLASLLFVLTFSIGAAVCAAPAKEVTGAHAGLEMSCADCHGTDSPEKRAPVSACTGCHGEYPDVAKLTEGLEPNPHASHQGEIRCTLCHKSHEPSVIYCNECHEFSFQIK